MKTKTLDTIQKLFTAGKVLSKIIFIFSVVGFILSAVTLITTPIVPGSLKLGGVDINSLLNATDLASKAEIYGKLAEGIVFCACEAVLAKLAELYFKKELEVGTPFDFTIAKKLLTLGICVTAVSFGATVLVAIGEAIINKFFIEAGTYSADLSMSGSIGIGVALIIMSFLCKYGAEILQAKNSSEE